VISATLVVATLRARRLDWPCSGRTRLRRDFAL